jgi:hypothetical protein
MANLLLILILILKLTCSIRVSALISINGGKRSRREEGRKHVSNAP